MQVRCFTDLDCRLSNEIESMSLRDCCVSDPRGTAYNEPGTEICGICVGKDNTREKGNLDQLGFPTRPAGRCVAYIMYCTCCFTSVEH